MLKCIYKFIRISVEERVFSAYGNFQGRTLMKLWKNLNWYRARMYQVLSNRRLPRSSFLLNGCARSCCIAELHCSRRECSPIVVPLPRLRDVGSGVMLLRSRKYIARAIAARRRELCCPGRCCRCESRLRTIAGRRSGRARVVWLMSRQFARSWIEIGRSRSTTLCINSIWVSIRSKVRCPMSECKLIALRATLLLSANNRAKLFIICRCRGEIEKKRPYAIYYCEWLGMLCIWTLREEHLINNYM